MKKTMFFLLQALMLCGSVVCASDSGEVRESGEVQKCYAWVGFPAHRSEVPCNKANQGESKANQGESKANQGRRSQLFDLFESAYRGR